MYFHIRYTFHYLNEKGIESILANLIFFDAFLILF